MQILLTNVFPLIMSLGLGIAVFPAGGYVYAIVAGLVVSVLASWIYLISISLRSHLHSPAIRQDCFSATSRHTKQNRDNAASRFLALSVKRPAPRHALPFVSIILPARNEQDNIRTCLKSILSQSYPNFEVVAVDDNSSDSTLNILKELQSMQKNGPKLNVVRIEAKPRDWTGKTWASQQGYFHTGDSKIIVFMDADGHFDDPDALKLAVGRMLEENLDVLTGVPFLPLLDFWSKIVMPVWNLYSEAFGNGMADVNNPRSKVAFLMGSFFMIRRNVFESVGGYSSVRGDLQEDRSLGRKLKSEGYAIKMFKVDTLMTALWSRDLPTLWNGIRRTVTPMAISKKSKPLLQMLTILAMIIMPFITWPILALQAAAELGHAANAETSAQNGIQPTILTLLLSGFGLGYHHFYSITFLVSFSLTVDSVICTLVIIAVAIKGVVKYRIAPFYSLFSVIGAIFLFACYASCTIPILIGARMKPIPWRDRPHELWSQDFEEKGAASA